MIYDVAIVGGGLVGSLSALLLAQLGFQVILLEKNEPVRESGTLGIDLRTVAVSQASKRLLESSGVWNSINATPYREMRVWEQLGDGELTFFSENGDSESLGFICENSEILCVMWERLRASSNINLIVGVQLQDIKLGTDYIELELEDDEILAKLLLGADGASSKVRSSLGIGSRDLVTRHHVLATNVKLQNGHGRIAWQKFLLEGPLAVLPTADLHVASIVWSRTESEAKKSQTMEELAFCAELTVALEGRFGAVESCDRRVLFPVKQSLVHNFNPLSRVVFIGDAARVIHPLAGQGVNIGFEDVAALLDILAFDKDDCDIGALEEWQEFSKNRMRKSQMMIEAMRRLDKIYSYSNPLVTLLRNKAVSAIDNNNGIKKRLIQQAQGFGFI